MSMYLGDLNARARGLGTRLLSQEELSRLTRARSLFSLQREMRGLGLVGTEAPATPGALEAAIRGRAAHLMAILSRWCNDGRRPVFAVILEDEERRAIQMILRGADQGAAAEARMSGIVPTANLSERALGALAAQPTMADVVRMLVLWDHPFGRALIGVTAGARPSLFETEIELQRAFAERASLRARQGGPELVAYVEQLVDLTNLWTALLHFPERAPELAQVMFIEGGRAIDRPLFDDLCNAERLEHAQDLAARTFRGSPIGTALTGDARPLSSLESAVLEAQIAEQKRHARTRPQSAAPLIAFSLQLRAEVLNLRRIIWGVALEAPAPLVQSEMVAT